MKVAFQQEDIQLLSSILQEELILEMPSVPVLEVKCAVTKDQLMILTQHPPGVSVDTDKIFTVLEESLQWQSQYHDEKIQLYVRVSGEKLPYSKKLITVQAKEAPEVPEIQLPEFNNDLDHNGSNDNGSDDNGSNKQVIFPPLEIPEISPPVTEDIIANNPFSSLIDDETSNPDFASLTDENISDNHHSSDNSFNSDTILSFNRSFESDVTFSSDISLSNDDDLENESANSFESDVSFGSDISLSNDDDLENESANSFESDVSFGSDISLSNDDDLETEHEEIYDPFEDEEHLSSTKKPFSPPPIPIIVGAVLGIAVIFGGGTFFMTRACIVGQCQELQTAAQFKTESQQVLSKATSEKELIPLQQQLNQVIDGLKTIPQFSPRYQEAQELTNNFSQQLTKINSVIQALQAGSQAEQSSQKPATSLDELRSRQALWRKAITPLESVKSSSELSQIVKTKLPSYKNNLQTINKQLLTEEAWQKKLATAKTVADAAIKRQAAARSANDWQRVEFGWKGAVNTLKSIPNTSTAYTEAQTLLIDYQQKLTLARNTAGRETRAVQNYQQATSFANQAKTYENKNQWQSAVLSWEQAVKTAQQVSQDSLQYSQAQALIEPYSIALAQAKEKFQLYGNLDQTRADLNSTCVNGIRFCNFTIENGRIIVRLTADYDQRLLSGSPELQNHFSTLQQALGVISENSNLPVFLYNSQGQERYMKNPQ
ncbi:hypothetical protein WJM97_04405 [Okeanomitos corallinicola TIOX110]|uniref:Uncharacterized protein n=1 Tax=Okeanomitos corallinicola TIOX110 TaxID=3133117 RepID=A0ABZ2UXI2_9CYAN